MRTVSEAPVRAAELDRLQEEWQGCQKCALARTRTQVVVGSGHPDADLMFVGEAPGYHEDRQGAPFVGQAGKVLESLLGSIGLSRPDVYIANVLKCRPPGNRDPQPDEIAACEGHLFAQVELIRPKVICTLGNFATKTLTGRPEGITKVCGRPQRRELAGLDVTIYPLFHPAAAMRTPSVLERLRADFSRIPQLLEDEPEPEPPEPELPAPPEPDAGPEPAVVAEPPQLGLFG